MNKNTKKINSKNTKMIAHRGMSGLEPENTLSAFVAAGNRTHYGIETDVHYTKDGKYVVIHDGNPSRVSGVDLIIEETDLATIREVIISDVDNTHDRIDLRIPTLQEYVKICERYDKKCILEMKSDFTSEQIEEMVQIYRDFDYLDGLIFISFSMENLLRYRALYPDMPCQYLCGELNEEIWKLLIEKHIDIDIFLGFVNEELINKAHANGLVVNAWTVDDPEMGQKFVDMGIDYITSNILE